jgi:plastocyanin
MMCHGKIIFFELNYCRTSMAWTISNHAIIPSLKHCLKYTYPPITVDINVENDRFDADNNNSTQIDTVTIGVGDTLRWTWREGIHTITSGVDSNDPNAGSLFDAPSDSSNQSFSFEFTEAGTFPCFCRFTNHSR